MAQFRHVRGGDLDLAGLRVELDSDANKLVRHGIVRDVVELLLMLLVAAGVAGPVLVIWGVAGLVRLLSGHEDD